MELFVEGHDLVDLDFFSVSDPICTLKIKDSNVNHATSHLVGETEVIDNNLNPKWLKSFCVQFIFTKDLDLKFEVNNYNDPDSRELIGEGEICLTEVMMAPAQTKKIKLQLPEKDAKGKKIRNWQNRGFLTIRADKIKKTEDIIKFQISAELKSRRFLCFGNDSPYLLI